MFNSKLKFFSLLILFTASKASKNETEKREDSNIKRKFLPFTFDDAAWVNPYYIPYQQNYPILAKITPINQENQKIAGSFRAYIHPSLISNRYYPYYAVLCEKDTVNSQKSTKIEIQKLQENHLKPLHEKLKYLNDKIKNLTKLFVDGFKTIESEKDEAAHIIPATSEPIKSEPVLTTPTEELLEAPEMEIKQVEFITFPPYRPRDESDNENSQTSIFQCEGVVCPNLASYCKITEHAIEPNYEKIVKKVYCMSKTERVLMKKEIIRDNPNRGESFDVTRTLDKQDQESVGGLMNDEFQSAMKNFKQNMFKTFGQH